MSDLERRLGALSPEARQRLEQALLARRRGLPARRSTAIAPRHRPGPARLSAAQRRLWFLDQLTPGSTTYNAVVALWLRGPVDLDLLAEAVAATIERHEVLHSVIRVVDDEPLQLVPDHWAFEMGRQVAQGGDREARRHHALSLAAELARHPYDLAHDLPVRAGVVETDVDEWLFVLAEHHIAFDGWSDDIAFREISEHYAGRLSGRPGPGRAALAIQYADYAEWQRDRIDAGGLAAHADYWRARLRDAPAVTRLPLDRDRPEHPRFDGRHLDVDLDHAAGLREFRVTAGATDFMVLVAAWAATLYRWSGESDLVLGTPMANRTPLEVESLIGFFSNTVPLRIRVDGSQSFAALVDHVRDVVLGAFEHQDLPFDLIVETVGPARLPGANPLFQVNVRVQSGPPPRLDLPSVRVQPVHVDLGISRFDLAIELQVRADRIGGYLEFNHAVLDQATVEGVLARLDQLLGAALADPSAPVWELAQPDAGGRRRARRPPVRHEGAEVAVHWLDLADAVDESCLSDAERARAARFVSEVERVRFARRRAHLRRLLAEVCGESAAGLRFEEGEHGRPRLADHPGVRFSASSSGSHGLVAVSEHELGVDVERLATNDSDRDVVRRLFAVEERLVLDAASPEAFPGLFVTCWTLKEAYVKATGLGLTMPLSSFAVQVADTRRPRLLRSSSRPGDQTRYSLTRLDVPGGGAAAALAVAHPDPRIWIHTG